MSLVSEMSEPGLSLSARISALDWAQVDHGLDTYGCATLSSLLSASQCDALVGGYGCAEGFRSRIDMERYVFGRGEYKYFAYPLPPLVASLRTLLFPRLVDTANRWNEALGQEARYPAEHQHFVDRCHAAGQTRPTPLLLRYVEGDYNRLHQDLYGEHVFPLQVAVLLSQPGRDFSGGEFVLTEQRPRAQSRAHVVSLQRGDAVVFATHNRPVPGPRGFRRVNLRHGVSVVRSGNRHALGVIFHDAK